MFPFRKKSKTPKDGEIVTVRGTFAGLVGSRAKGYKIDLQLGREQERVTVLGVPDNRTDHFPHSEYRYKTYIIDGVRYLIDPYDGITTYKVVPYADRNRTDDE